MPLPYAEAGYGYPEAGQTVVNVTNGKLIRLLVEDEPFDVRYGELRSHERVLDLRAGVLRRTLDWASPTGRRVADRLDAARVVHAACRSPRSATRWSRSTARCRVVVQSELVANEPLPPTERRPARGRGARVAAALGEYSGARDTRAVLVHSTRAAAG